MAPLHWRINVSHKVVKFLASECFVSHLKAHLLSLNKSNDRLQQRAATFVLEWIEQRVVVNGSLYVTHTSQIVDGEEITRGQSNLEMAALNSLPLTLAVQGSGWASKGLHPEQELNLFSHFCRVQTDRHTKLQDHQSQQTSLNIQQLW